MVGQNITAPVRPLVRERGAGDRFGWWESSCGRFGFESRKSGWRIGGLHVEVTWWLEATGLRNVTFPRLRDAVDVLEAHLTVSPPPVTPTPQIRWRRTSPDRWVSHDDTWEIVRENDCWWTRMVGTTRCVDYRLTVRAAKARVERRCRAIAALPTAHAAERWVTHYSG